MRRSIVIALIFLIAPAAAQDVETVEVTAASLAGLWKITWPVTVRPGETSPEATIWCRIAQAHAPSVHCFDRPNGALTVADGKIRILWSPAMTPQSNVIEAEMTSADSFVGGERVRLAGITILRSGRLTGVRRQIDPQAPDAAGKATQLRLILEEWARGALSPPFEKTALLELPGREMLRQLGVIRSLAYLDRRGIWRDGIQVPDFFSLYLVEFQNGNLLCGLHQREDGMLDGFRCA
jgi:hypothetical protein